MTSNLAALTAPPPQVAWGRHKRRGPAISVGESGEGLLALASGKMKETGGKLAVVVGPGRVLDILKLTQITSVVTVRGAVAEAELTFGKASAGV